MKIQSNVIVATNKMKNNEEYEMDRDEAIDEHKRLIKALKSANVKVRQEEAKRQAKELKKIMKGEED